MFSGIRPEKQKELEQKMKKLGICEKDITEQFIRSGGHGGQKLNKTSSCVYLKHIPTGIEVKCQQERTQSQNRFIAKRILTDKIETMVMGRMSAEQQKIEKIRRQKRKRSKRAKEKMLQSKKFNSQKKELRSKVSF